MSLFINLNFNEKENLADEIKVSFMHNTNSGRGCYSVTYKSNGISISGSVYHKRQDGPVKLASKALAKIAAALEDIYSIPEGMIRKRKGGGCYMLFADIPEYFREEFSDWMFAQTTPSIPEHGEAACCYVGDYERWLDHKKYGAILVFDQAKDMGCHQFQGPNGMSGWLCSSNIYEYEGFIFEYHNYMGPVRLRKKDWEPSKHQGERFFATFEKWDKLSKKDKSETQLFG